MLIRVDMNFLSAWRKNPQKLIRELHSHHGTTRVCPEAESGSVVFTKGGDSPTDIICILK